MHITTRLLLQLLLPLLLISSCSTCSDRIAEQMENVIDSIQVDMQRDSVRRARAALLQYQIDSLKVAAFRQNSAAIYNNSLWVHIAWDSKLDLDRNGLMAVVYDETG